MSFREEPPFAQGEAAPPVRPKTAASFAAFTYGHCQSISLCFDAHTLSPEDGRAMLDLFEVHGYQLVLPPLLEYVESLLTGTGHDLDLLQCPRRMFRLRAGP